MLGKLRYVALIAMTLLAATLAGCGCQDDPRLKLRITGPHEATVGTPVTLKATLIDNNERASALNPATVAWNAQPLDSSTISQDGVFTASKAGVYLVDADQSGVKADTFTITVTDGFAGTYKGVMSLSMGDQTAQIPFEFTVDAFGGVKGGFEHSWNRDAHIKATFAGTVADDGTMTTSGKATNSGDSGGVPFSSSGDITVNGKITGTTFTGGLNGSSDWVAERQ